MCNIVLGDISVFCPWHKDKQSIYILPESFQVLCMSLLSESRSIRFGFHLHGASMGGADTLGGFDNTAQAAHSEA
jgi:hypothetical protein